MARKELDRFDTTAKRDVQILTKLTALIVGIILFCSIVIGTISLTVFEHGYMKEVQDEVVFTSNGVKLVLEDKTAILKSNADHISANTSVIASLERGEDDGSIKYCVKGAVADTNAISILAITDKNGVVVADGGAGVEPGTNLSSVSIVKRALNGSSGVSYESIGNLPYAIVYAKAIEHLGAVVVAYDLTDGDFVSFVENSFDVATTIFKDTVRVGTSLEGMKGTSIDNKQIVNTVLGNGDVYSGKATIDKKGYFAVYEPLKDSTGSITGMFFIAKSVKTVSAIRNSTLKFVVPITIVSIIVLSLISFMFIRWLMWRIANVTNFLKELESGDADLTKRSKLFIRDEIGDLVIHFDFFLDKMQQIVSQIKDSENELSNAGNNLSKSTSDSNDAISHILSNIEGISSQVENQGNSVNQTVAAVDEISKNITTLNQMIDGQSAGVAQASSAVEQMIGNISSVNTSVDKMASSFSQLTDNAQVGIEKQKDVNDRIQKIEQQSQMLLEANSVISSIAEQTNLLAMNAAIEAAHAGEAGKGFSVVADEIRKLSETSSAQSRTIGEQLNEIRNSITEVVSASDESSNALASVSEKIKETDELVIQIKSAMQEQNEGSKQIGMALKDMNDSTVEVGKSSKEMSLKNEKIMQEVNSLQNASNAIRESMNEMSYGANRISNTGSVMNDISNKMRDSISKIGNQINLFKV